MTLHTYTSNQSPYQVSTSCTLRRPKYSSLNKILKLKVTSARSKVTSRSHYDIAQIHPKPMYLQLSTFYTLRISRYSLDKILEIKVTTTRSKVKSRSHHDNAYLHLSTNVPPRYQPSICYSSLVDIAQTCFYRSRSLQQRQRSNHGHTMMLHTYTS